MAKKVEVSYVDDLDPTQTAEGSVTFAYQGTEYSIDLSEKNRKVFEKVLEKYTKVATVTNRKRRKSAGKTVSNSAAIREWAAANGHKVNARGRLPQETIQAFEASTMPKFSAAG